MQRAREGWRACLVKDDIKRCLGLVKTERMRISRERRDFVKTKEKINVEGWENMAERYRTARRRMYFVKIVSSD